MQFSNRLVGLLFIMIVLVSTVPGVQAQSRPAVLTYDIPQQQLDSALTAFAKQSKVEILYAPDIVLRKRTGGIHGSYGIADALTALLGGTGLHYRVTESGAYLIEKDTGERPLAGAPTENENATQSPSSRATDSGDPAQKAAGLEEIVVTAQKRRENLQDVPLSVTAFTQQTLVAAGVDAVADLIQVDPSLSFTVNSGAVMPFLRGIGNPAAGTIGNEASVPVYIDDVYYTRLAPAYLELANIEQVEVLKGPQGTLFGRNASGGAIQIYTRDPADKANFDGKVGYANYNTPYGQLYVGGPISETVRADISASALNQADGWGRNVNTGAPTYENEYVNLRSKIVADVTDTTRLHLAAFFVQQHTGQGFPTDRYRGTIGGTPGNPAYGPSQPIYPLPSFYDGSFTNSSEIEHKGYGGSVKLEQTLAPAQLVSISAYRKAIESIRADGDGTKYNWLAYRLDSADRQISQELQLKSLPASNIPWILGAYYLNSRQGYDPTVVTGDAIDASGLAQLNIYGSQTIKSKAGYGQTTLPIIGDTTHLTLGLRYTSDSVSGEGFQQAVIPGVGVFPGQVPYGKTFVFNKVTDKIVLDHKLTSDVMAFVSYSRGYKSGTFNTLPLTSDPSLPETVDAYELGVKSELLDRTLRINAAAFENKVANPQVLTVITTGPIASIGLTNAQGAQIRGMELNVEAAVSEGLMLHFDTTYLNALYTKFTNAPYFQQLNAPPYGLAAPVAVNASGNRIAQVPRWRADTGFTYNVETSRGVLGFTTTFAFTSNYFWDADNRTAQSSYYLLNSSLLYSPKASDHWNVRIWGKNLTGRKYYVSELETAGTGGNASAAAAPRTAGIEVGFKF